MNAPVATYRLQFNASFKFSDALEIVDYLKALGVSHVYSSPIFKSRQGSLHGYDGVDPNAISPDLGSLNEFESLIDELKARGNGLGTGHCPNHLAYSPENQMLMDVLELREGSRYFKFFDIDWDHPSESLRGKLLAPFLGESIEDCLRNDRINLVYKNGFKIKYFQWEFPVSVDSYKEILESASSLLGPLCKEGPELLKFKQILGEIHSYSARDLRDCLIVTSGRSTVLLDLLNKVARKINADRALLLRLIEGQNFRLSFWKAATREINYRRFFDINDLICLRIEDMEVFEQIHALLLRLLDGGKIDGIRVDHVDGLKDPDEYLHRIRAKAPGAYIVVEKILMPEEDLPDKWPVQGTTGYDFLNYLNRLFVDPSNEPEFNRIYSNFSGVADEFPEVLRRSKQAVVERLFSGDLDNLSRLFLNALNKRGHGREIQFARLREALFTLLTSFTAYRSYLSKESKDLGSRTSLREALARSARSRPELSSEIDAIEKLLNEIESSEEALGCFMRLQQLTGPAMAKGLEDTALYLFNRLISLNEVGGDPSLFGISADTFHSFMETRSRRWPLSMNATSTHDTKRGEDVRARLNVLSEIPLEWRLRLGKWSSLNIGKRRILRDRSVPERNEEYYIYQTLIGALPFEPHPAEFVERMKNHMTKALREAKTNSSWLEPDEEHEGAVRSFIMEILDPSCGNEFLREFLPFQRKIAYYGMFNSLSQALIKITSPGVPDFYQGSELWDLNLVDPDNRRPIDFERRRELLDAVMRAADSPSRLGELLSGFEDGRIKLYEIHKALESRERRSRLFLEGDYTPVSVRGAYRDHIAAFCRRYRDDWSITVVPRLLSRLIRAGERPLGSRVWEDTCIILPKGAREYWTDCLSNNEFSVEKDGENYILQIGNLFNQLPVALLLSR